MALYIVVGPPGAGKTTWVTEHAKDGDVVIDLDRIASALTVQGADGHTHGRTVRSVAHRARLTAISSALRYVDKVDVFVIHTKPRPEAMEKYARHNAQVITIDPGQDVVMQRLAEQRSGVAKDVAQQWYAERDATPANVQPSREW
ncbi:AAA family ATPase [Actinomadura sp. HBU206391]|uniref:AAA family ATPase n=1 Tax=Actinomadura sp. HBU206391 TaxID=2731692 RepID=UPI00164EECFD|nr:AAA family ATPase [Actinomadura sp. HBU206391]MBC6458411.1 AAA family ATPase [Actinomadura sp. HBU206391]